MINNNECFNRGCFRFNNGVTQLRCIYTDRCKGFQCQPSYKPTIMNKQRR